MPAYRAYQWEHEAYPEFLTIKLDVKEQRKYVKKLCRHFHINEPTIINKAGHWAFANTFWWRLKLPHTCSLGLVVHEFAHLLTHTRWGKGQHHNKKFKRELKRCYTFAKRWLESAPKEVGSYLPANHTESDVTPEGEPPDLFAEEGDSEKPQIKSDEHH